MVGSSSKVTISRGVHYTNIVSLANNATKDLKIDVIGVAPNYQWECSANHDHNRYSPLCTIHNLNSEPFKRHTNKCDKKRRSSVGKKRENNEKIVLFSVMNEKMLDQPKKCIITAITSYHVLINNTRTQHGILPLIRENALDEAASDHAKYMAIEQDCKHSNLKQLILERLSTAPWRRIGENVCCGKSLTDIHTNILENSEYVAEKNNILDRRFSSFGVGVATSSNGELYVCQIFKA